MSGLIARTGGEKFAQHMLGISSLEGFEKVIKLASNENPLGPSPKAVAAIATAIDELHRYSEAGYVDLKQAIAERYGLDSSRIVVGPGSDELLTRVARAYAGSGDEIVHSAHCYGKFPIYANIVGATPVRAADRDFQVDVDAMLGCVTERTRIVMLANPDNPAGTWISGAELRRLHAGLGDNVLLAIDGAYTEFVTVSDYEDGIALVESAENVVVTRTFSKIYGLADLRLGWLYGPPDVVEVVSRLSLSFPISGLAVAGGMAALCDVEFATRSRDHNETWLAWLTERLESLGLSVHPSQTNFVLARFPDTERKTARAANEFLLLRGIIPRVINGPDYEDALRISVGESFEMLALGDALAEFLEA